MKAKLIVTTCFFFAASIGIAQSPAYTNSQIKSMTQNAKTNADYIILRDYYYQQAQVFQNKADEEKQEWNRRQAKALIYTAKYPSPVDSAHYLYDSYSQSAKDAMTKGGVFAGLVKKSN